MLKQVDKIDNLKKGNSIPPEELKASKSMFECFFTKNLEVYSFEESKTLIGKLFAKYQLDLKTIIKYGQFLRIDSEIDEKN